MSWRRLNVSNCRVKPAARSAAWVICCAERAPVSSRPDASNNEAWPWMTVRMLLKSCATPPASWPMASIFCDWRNCSSNRRCVVTSRNKLNISNGRPCNSMNESVISKVTTCAVVQRVLALDFAVGGAVREMLAVPVIAFREDFPIRHRRCVNSLPSKACASMPTSLQ